MKRIILLIACLSTLVLMITFTEAKPVAEKQEEAMKDPEPLKKDSKESNDDDDVDDESEDESEEEKSGSGLKDGNKYC